MLSLKDRINNVNTVYYYSLDVDELQTALNELEDVLSDRVLSAQNKDSGEALRMRILCKIYALAYFMRFRDSIIEKLDACVAENMPVATERGYNKSAQVMTETQNLLKLVKQFLITKDELSAFGKSDRLLSGMSGLLTSVDTLIAQVECLPLKSPFGDDVVFIDIKARLAEHFADWKSEFYEAYAKALERSVKCKKIDYTNYDYFPVPDYEEGGKKVNAVILNTPFADEARLYAAHVVPKCEPLIEFDANEFANSEEGVSRVFAYLDYKKCATLITNTEMISDAVIDSFLRRVMLAGKNGVSVFVVDTDGGKMYDRALAVASADEDLRVLDISCSYITMPPFKDVVDELVSIKLAQSEAECREKLKEMPFLGFMGLNEIVSPEYQSSWEKHGKKISSSNAAAARRYLSKLRSSTLFIDYGWGDFSSGLGVTDDVGEFDYDDIGGLDAENIRRIVESSATIFGKCGMIVRYCTTGAGDVTVLERLSREELTARIALATKLVFRILRVPIDPEVEVLDELSNKGAGGLCCLQGKLIQYKYSSCRRLSWLVDLIVHESFHALQHKLKGGNWTPWYYDNMGITKGRTIHWGESIKIYDSDTNSPMYKVHMFERDAYAFSIDCQEALDYYWNTVDLV